MTYKNEPSYNSPEALNSRLNRNLYGSPESFQDSPAQIHYSLDGGRFIAFNKNGRRYTISEGKITIIEGEGKRYGHELPVTEEELNIISSEVLQGANKEMETLFYELYEASSEKKK